MNHPTAPLCAAHTLSLFARSLSGPFPLGGGVTAFAPVSWSAVLRTALERSRKRQGQPHSKTLPRHTRAT